MLTIADQIESIARHVQTNHVRVRRQPIRAERQMSYSSIFGVTDTLNPDFSQAFNLVDSFIPEESKKRVKIEDMKFYISGDGNTTEKKVTIVFTLALMPRIGVPLIGLSESKLRVQTTISERFFKQN